MDGGAGRSENEEERRRERTSENFYMLKSGETNHMLAPHSPIRLVFPFFSGGRHLDLFKFRLEGGDRRRGLAALTLTCTHTSKEPTAFTLCHD